MWGGVDGLHDWRAGRRPARARCCPVPGFRVSPRRCWHSPPQPHLSARRHILQHMLGHMIVLQHPPRHAEVAGEHIGQQALGPGLGH